MLTNFYRGAGRAVLLLICLAAALSPAYSANPEYRALWVDVFHSGLRSRAEADTMLQTARDAGYNTIIIQVRKACDAFYNGTVEPKNNAVEAGFDPLQYITERAHQFSPRMDVYAWLVTYRARISGDQGWKNPRHVFQQHPEWMSETMSGKKTAGSDMYYMDPGVPQVIDYNLTVVRDILSRYDVDGLMFDYIRYPESTSGPSQWGYNPIAINRFNKLTGKSGKPAADDPEFAGFRRRQINDHMRKIYAHVKAWRPRVKVGAATITWGSFNGDFSRTSAYSTIMQDWQTMAMEGWLDVIMPMNYKREGIAAQAKDHRDWAAFLANLGQQSGRAAVNIVDGEELNSLSGILTQVRATRNLPGMAGISTYAYAQPRAGSKAIPDRDFFQSIKSQLFSSPATVPEAAWLTRPTQGIVKGVVTRGGKAVDGARVTLAGRSTYTDGTGFYAFARVAPGQVNITAEDAGGPIGNATVAVQVGAVAEAPVAAK